MKHTPFEIRALTNLIRYVSSFVEDPPKNVVMLTATPVNNSLWDLYYLLNYFIKNDAAFASKEYHHYVNVSKLNSGTPLILAQTCSLMF